MQTEPEFVQNFLREYIPLIQHYFGEKSLGLPIESLGNSTEYLSILRTVYLLLPPRIQVMVPLEDFLNFCESNKSEILGSGEIS
ncbi:MAG: hypothetical protein KDK54_05230 [Leptospiraceae bacterium]|nr:hypothetical protein [Leptospiraceae bacterium]